MHFSAHSPKWGPQGETVTKTDLICNLNFFKSTNFFPWIISIDVKRGERRKVVKGILDIFIQRKILVVSQYSTVFDFKIMVNLWKITLITGSMKIKLPETKFFEKGTLVRFCSSSIWNVANVNRCLLLK